MSVTTQTIKLFKQNLDNCLLNKDYYLTRFSLICHMCNFYTLELIDQIVEKKSSEIIFF